jgi:integrase/recombinase XerD
VVREMSTRTETTVTVVPLVELAASWAVALAAENKSPQTQKAYAAGIAGFLSWHEREFPGAVPVLDAASARAYLADLRRSGQKPGTMRLRFAALRLFSGWLVEEGETETDPLAKMRPPKLDAPVVESLSDAELDALIKACKGTGFAARRDEAIVRLLAQTGLRAGECMALTVGDVDLHAGTVRIRHAKGGKHRTVFIGPVVARAVDRYMRARRSHRLAHTDTLWLGEQGRQFGYQGASRALKARAEAAGVEGFHLHRMRHTAASRWVAAGGSESGAMAQMGWSDASMLRHYMADQRERLAMQEAARLRLDEV